jgi:hypothetical protein
MGGKLLLIGLLIIGGGVVSLALGYSAQRRDNALRKWPSVQGTVGACSIVKTTEARLRVPVTTGGASPDPSYRLDRVWAISVEYHYPINGKTYGGREATSSLLLENIRGNESAPSPRMQALAARITPGSEMDVHYNPSDPHQSYLIFIDDPGKPRLFRTGVFCVALGILVAAGSRFL